MGMIERRYQRSSFREIRPEASVWTPHREKAEIQQAIDNFNRMNRQPSLLITIGKALWWLGGMCIWTLIAAGSLLGLYEVLRTLVTGKVL